MSKFKLFSIVSILGLFCSLSYADTPPEPTISNLIKLQATGSRQGDGLRKVKLVRNASQEAATVAMASGDAVVYSSLSDDGVTIAYTTTSKDATFAGILGTAISTSDAAAGTDANSDQGRRNWGWVIVHGPANAKVSSSGTNVHAAGDLFFTSRDAGAVTTFEALRGAATASIDAVRAVGAAGGFFFDASVASNTSEEVFVRAE